MTLKKAFATCSLSNRFERKSKSKAQTLPPIRDWVSKGDPMAYEVTMPRLGWTMEEGVFRRMAEAGRRRSKGRRPALHGGRGQGHPREVEVFEGGILRLPANAPASGDVIPVGALLAYIVQAGESLPEESGHAARQVAPTEQEGAARRTATVPAAAQSALSSRASCRGRTRHANYQPAGAARGGRVGGRLGAVKRQRSHGTDRRTGRARRRGDRRIRDGRGRHAGSASLCRGGRY